MSKAFLYTTLTSSVCWFAISLAAADAQQLIAEDQSMKSVGETVILPGPNYIGKQSLEEVLLRRRSVRDYSKAALRIEEISQLLWAAQGITSPDGFRTAPSAGALYPLEVYLVASRVDGLPAGIYKYDPRTHALKHKAAGDVRSDLARAALEQESIPNSAAIVVLAAVYERTTTKYGERGRRYVHMEVGHAAQNISLQAVAINLGTVVIGAFHDERVKTLLKMEPREQPLYIIPVGRPR